jgi:hypothetical protein
MIKSRKCHSIASLFENLLANTKNAGLLDGTRRGWKQPVQSFVPNRQKRQPVQRVHDNFETGFTGEKVP